MTGNTGEPAGISGGTATDHRTISISQRGNLKALETALRKQWRLGQNIVLCWSADERGILVIFVPHYFLGNFCARPGVDGAQDNEAFVRELISGSRCKPREEFFDIANRLDIAPGFIRLDTPLADDPAVVSAVEQLIKRYGLSYVSDRAVLLFDIAEFSLFTPFEQASQLNSLSYSLNSAYNKLLAKGIEVHFSRTTTGDGYYVWNRALGAQANCDLFFFLLLVVADNAVARRASHGNTVPVIRVAYHVGSHYELYQAEGVNPTVHSYIVGDVTIELARMAEKAQPQQVLVGHFETASQCAQEPATEPSGPVSAPDFIEQCNDGLSALQGIQFAGKTVERLHCRLSGAGGDDDRRVARRLLITDKHGLSRQAYNLEFTIEFEDRTLTLGLPESALPDDSRTAAPDTAIGNGHTAAVVPGLTIDEPTLQEQVEELASLLQDRFEREPQESN
tara:strand:+ start:7168 stop:8517 length:1350 start_codon:yes stop_codon:yes gene_type:complete